VTISITANSVLNTIRLYTENIHGKNSFAEVSKILDRSENIILLAYQNNYVECSTWLLENIFFKTFYLNCSSFEIPTKLFSNLYLAKFLDRFSKIVLSI